jgi:hypothetical protein
MPLAGLNTLRTGPGMAQSTRERTNGLQGRGAASSMTPLPEGGITYRYRAGSSGQKSERDVGDGRPRIDVEEISVGPLAFHALFIHLTSGRFYYLGLEEMLCRDTAVANGRVLSLG